MGGMAAAGDAVVAVRDRLPHLPGWVIEIEVGCQPCDAPVAASLLALADGAASVIGDLDGDPDQLALVLAAGAFGRGTDGAVRLLPGPVWAGIDPSGSTPRRWVLDLRSGVLMHECAATGLRIGRFQSVARPGIGCVRVDHAGELRVTPGPGPPRVPSQLAADFEFVERPPTSDGIRAAATTSDRAAVTVAVTDRTRDGGRVVERYAAVRRGGAGPIAGPMWSAAIDAAADARAAGFDVLLREHADVWASRWATADIEILGDERSQLAVRHALFHLLSCATETGESGVGARGLTGLAYSGHVFWDTDVYVLPTLAATLPAAARSAIEYRINRIGAARAEAEARGLPGIRIPWESADEGTDVTPTAAVDADGATIPIHTGALAEHINSDVAWSVLHYVDWTGDRRVIDGAGGALVTETAEYLAARAEVDAVGAAHVRGVIGPDEYHEGVDDNAYTNRMLAWHLEQAARLHPDAATARRWRELAAALVTGFDPTTGRHEQFSGFDDLVDERIGEIATLPIAADVLLGRDRVARSQVLKQPDVLMLHHLVPDDCPDGSLAADLDHYLPRTAHGSSLSPAVCASLLARAGRPDEALELFDLAARLDLDDLTGTTSGGLHLATMGGLWQAAVWGFAGVRPTPHGLRIDPHLPARWEALTVNLVYHGEHVIVAIDHDRITVSSRRPVRVIVDGRQMLTRTQIRYRTRDHRIEGGAR